MITSTCPVCGELISNGSLWCSSSCRAKSEVTVGKKFDHEKPMMALLPPRALEQVAMAFTYGAKKYGHFNYMGGLAFTRIISALLRHIFAYLRGEDIDPESGLPHWAHMGACVLMLGEMTYEHPELDDRYKRKEAK